MKKCDQNYVQEVRLAESKTIRKRGPNAEAKAFGGRR